VIALEQMVVQILEHARIAQLGQPPINGAPRRKTVGQ